MKFLFGFIIALVGYALASSHLNQSIVTYWDFVAFSIVLLGTLAVLAISFPTNSYKFLFATFWNKFKKTSSPLEKTAQRCSQITLKGQPILNPGAIDEQLLNDGLELISLGFSREKIQDLLVQRYQNHSRKLNQLIHWLRRNAKYPPAFGLSGTVLGLIHLMRGISVGIDSKEVGVRMSVALVATLYGILISNLILNPLSEWLAEELKKDEVKSEMAIICILSLADNANPLEIQESINSYLEPEKRINIISQTATMGQFS